MRVVMHGEPLRGGRCQVGVRLNREAEPRLQPAAVERDRRPFRCSAWSTSVAPAANSAATRSTARLREAPRTPGNVVRVVARRQRRTVPHQPERRHPDRRLADEPVDIGDVSRPVKRSPSPRGMTSGRRSQCSAKKLSSRDRIERQRERACGSGTFVPAAARSPSRCRHRCRSSRPSRLRCRSCRSRRRVSSPVSPLSSPSSAVDAAGRCRSDPNRGLDLLVGQVAPAFSSMSCGSLTRPPSVACATRAGFHVEPVRSSGLISATGSGCFQSLEPLAVAVLRARGPDA